MSPLPAPLIVKHTDDRPAHLVWAPLPPIEPAQEEPQIPPERMPSELTAALALLKRAEASAQSCQAASKEVASSQKAAFSDAPLNALKVAASVGLAHNLLSNLAKLTAKITTGSAYNLHQLAQAHEALIAAVPWLHRLAVPEMSDAKVVGKRAMHKPIAHPVTDALSHLLQRPFVASPGPFQSNAFDLLLALHGHLKVIAMSLKNLTEECPSQPGKSGESGPCQAMAMVCRQLNDNDMALQTAAHASARGAESLQSLLSQKLPQSIRLLSDVTTLISEYAEHSTSSNKDMAQGLFTSLAQATSPLLQVA